MSNNIWEEIHHSRTWGKYPCEELVVFIGKNFFNIPFNERKEIKILELGCGQGANLWFLVKEGFDSYGIDISESAINKANKYLSKSYDLKANLTVGNIKTLPYSNDFFDIVIDNVSLQHLTYSDQIIVLKEVSRVLKSKGVFWKRHIGDESWGFESGKSIDYKTFEDVKEGPLLNVGTTCMLSDLDLREMLEKGNFSVKNLEKQLNTYSNQEHALVHWIIQAVNK